MCWLGGQGCSISVLFFFFSVCCSYHPNPQLIRYIDMWLLNIDRLDRPALVQASEESAPRYAILSHTWGREEVTFQDVQALNRKQWSRAVSQTALANSKQERFYQDTQSGGSGG